MITNNSIKEYYTKLQGLYSQCYDMLKALNQSLSSKSTEITVNVSNIDGSTNKVRIPSFLYLESKIEEIGNNLDQLYSIPDSGTAWMTKYDESYKVVLEKNGLVPVTPTISMNKAVAGYTDNNFLKDLVSPKTYIKINIPNLQFNASSILMKKVVLHESDLYDTLSKMDLNSYSDFKAAMYNYNKGIDYDEYDNEISLPVKSCKYTSKFDIVGIPEDNIYENPWNENGTSKLSYKLHLDTIEYHNIDDTTISYTLKAGDLLAMKGKNATWKVKSVDSSDMTVIIEESVGHVALQSIDVDPSMSFIIYNENYNEYNYIDVPLEENQYIIVFLSVISNNMRSEWSRPLLINLNSIYVEDEGGNYVKDSYGNNLTYIEYYHKYCTNIGDLILGITETAYPQISNLTPSQLKLLQNSDEIQQAVSNTFDGETILQVVPINKHLTDDITTEDIKSLHENKNNLTQQLQAIQLSINEAYNKLTTTDFSKDNTTTQQALKQQLDEYYTTRNSLQKQLNSVIDNINIKASDLKVTGNSVKYRVRGVTSITELSNIIKDSSLDNIDVIGLDVEYKYKSTTKDTSTVTVVNSSTFTDWNKLYNIDRQRKLVFTSSGYGVEYVDYSSTDNIVKWNQIDIPIQQGEDVIIRLRYKLNVGQPFMNIYTPWSDEKTVIFPSEYKEDVDLTDILTQNNDDTITSAFSKTLIDDGYAEHVQDKVVTSDQKFFHMPESIYSGFNTGENKMISLKDKLNSINNEIETWKTLVDAESNSKYEVYLNYDNTSMLLSSNVLNTVNIYNNNELQDIYAKKNMNIVIKNTGSVRLNLYSIFPGNTDIELLNSNIDIYKDSIVNYERIPLIINNEISAQHLGQWIYFRENSAWNKNPIYYSSSAQNIRDEEKIKQGSPLIYESNYSEYMPLSNKQALLGYRVRSGTAHSSSSSESFIKWRGLHIDKKNVVNGNLTDKIYKIGLSSTNDIQASETLTEMYNNVYKNNPSWFVYDTSDNSNKWIVRYEDITGTYGQGKDKKTIHLDNTTTFTKFCNNDVSVFGTGISFFGAFVYPEIENIQALLTEGKEKSSKYVEVGESLSIPITLEYYVNTNHPNISKSIYFDLRPSLIKDPFHYMIQINCNYDYTTSDSLYNSNESNAGIASDLT